MKSVPFKFAESVFLLDWNDINWGCRKGILQWQDAVKFAIDQIADETHPLVIELAIVDTWRTEEIIELATKISAAYPEDEEAAKQKWLIISLAWGYHEREKSPDPLGLVEEIYADFDYPSEIESIVRFMPSTDGYDPHEHSLEENEDRLMENWRRLITVSNAGLLGESR